MPTNEKSIIRVRCYKFFSQILDVAEVCIASKMVFAAEAKRNIFTVFLCVVSKSMNYMWITLYEYLGFLLELLELSLELTPPDCDVTGPLVQPDPARYSQIQVSADHPARYSQIKVSADPASYSQIRPSADPASYKSQIRLSADPTSYSQI